MQNQQPKAYILVASDPNEIQKGSAHAAMALNSIVRTCIGPRAMQKMVLTKINSIELTNDGNSILREIDVGHPAARCLIELSQTQDDECGDGTTSVLIFSSELLVNTVPLLSKYHPVKVCKALNKAKEISLNYLEEISVFVNDSEILNIVRSSVSTKLCSILKIPIPELAVESVRKITPAFTSDNTNKAIRIDLKTDIKVISILGSFEESEVIDGVLFEKEIVHSQMRRKIENPSILVLDIPLEYKKGESVTSLELLNSEDFRKTLLIEEDQIRKMCDLIVKLKPDLVLTEKGICELALSIMTQNNITAIRRVKKSDLIRICKSTGAILLSRLEVATQKNIGKAGLFEYLKIGKEYFCKISNCSDPKSVTVVLRAPSKDLLTEIERNFYDAAKVAKNIIEYPRLVPGGGGSEIGISIKLKKSSSDDFEKEVFEKCIKALKSIPSMLITNSGVSDTIDVLKYLEEFNNKMSHYGINGVTGEISDMRNLVMEPIRVKSQCIKSSFETVMQLLRVDGIIETKSK